MYCILAWHLTHSALSYDYTEANTRAATAEDNPSTTCIGKLIADALTNAAPSPSAFDSVPFCGRPEDDAEGLADPEADEVGVAPLVLVLVELVVAPALVGERTLSMTWLLVAGHASPSYMKNPILKCHVCSQQVCRDISQLHS